MFSLLPHTGLWSMEKNKPSGNNISLIAVCVCGKAWLGFLGKMSGLSERGGCRCSVGAEREEIILLGSFFWPSSVHRDPLLAGVQWDAGTSHIRDTRKG